jgi:uncharacterized phage protein (predicted DNA packaging)
MYINLDTIKKHLNINSDFTDDDEYLIGLESVAERVVEKNIDCDLSYYCNECGELEAPLLHAMLLLIGNYYANRESVAFANSTNVPYSYQYLIDLFRDYKGDKAK